MASSATDLLEGVDSYKDHLWGLDASNTTESEMKAILGENEEAEVEVSSADSQQEETRLPGDTGNTGLLPLSAAQPSPPPLHAQPPLARKGREERKAREEKVGRIGGSLISMMIGEEKEWSPFEVVLPPAPTSVAARMKKALQSARQVFIYINVFAVSDVDTVAQTFKANFFMRACWEEPEFGKRIKYDPEWSAHRDDEKLEQYLLKQGVWEPRLMFVNAVEPVSKSQCELTNCPWRRGKNGVPVLQWRAHCRGTFREAFELQNCGYIPGNFLANSALVPQLANQLTLHCRRVCKNRSSFRLPSADDDAQLPPPSLAGLAQRGQVQRDQGCAA